MTKHIHLARPDLGEEELNEIREVLETRHIAQGPKVAEFEKNVADYIGVPYAYATTSATTALHLGLVVLDIGPGDEVLVPDFTFPATVNVVFHQNATPVLVDVDLDTFTMSIEDMKAKTSANTKAIMPVHAFGVSANMDPIMAHAKAHDLAVLEDAACALGTTYQDKHCGAIGTMGCFSFHPRKVITTGEGGMITTADEALAHKIQVMRNQGGFRREGRFTFEDAGYNYRMSDVQGAIGVAQMRKLEGLIDGKRALAKIYEQQLSSLDEVTLPIWPAWGGHIYQSYVVMLNSSIDRDGVITHMRSKGVETTLGTYSLHTEPYIAKRLNHQPGQIPNGYAAYQQSLTLPLYPPMTEEDITFVVEIMKQALVENRK